MNAAQGARRYPAIEEHLNLPQAFTHFALIDTAVTLERVLDGHSGS
jgi:hypothetical protein